MPKPGKPMAFLALRLSPYGRKKQPLDGKPASHSTVVFSAAWLVEIKNRNKFYSGSYIEIGVWFYKRRDWMGKRDEILHVFPDFMRPQWEEAAGRADEIQEIRLRTGRQIILMMQNRERYLTESGHVTENRQEGSRISENDMEAVLNHICDYSVYAFEDEIRQGFLTIPGGHRIGLAGQVILEDKRRIRNMKHIRYMNIRISHEVKGAADKVLPYIYENRKLLHCLLISPPGGGKTTLLRDMIRQISDGNRFAEGMNVSVVDERSEIAGSYMGKPQNDVGMRTDILDACPKALGMMMLIRSMAPDVVAVDELGCEEDMKAVNQVMQCGSRIIATIHGDSLEDILRKDFFRETAEHKIFGRYIVLEKRNGKCMVKAIYDRGFHLCCGE